MDARSPHRALGPPQSVHPSPAAARVSRRRFRTLNLAMNLPLLAVVGVLLVARQAQTWPEVVVLGLGLAAALVAFERWTAGEILRVAAPCLVVAAAVWLVGALVMDSRPQSAYYSIVIVGGLTIPQLPRHRGAAAIGLGAFVAGVGVLGLLTGGPADVDDLIAEVILPTGLTAILTGLMFPNKGFYDTVADLEAAGDREAELAVIRERVRFASDLHDIQGHTLHVVKLKVALARKLLPSDIGRVEEELREVYDLIGDTIAQTKDLAHGQRRLNLSAELENARNLLEAAGIHVRVDRPTEVGVRAIDLLGQVLREATTNILRHSRARLVHITVSEHSITVVNDGVVDDVLPELQGLAVLARRVSDDRGELTVRLEGGRFLTAATFPPPAPGIPTVTAGTGDR